MMPRRLNENASIVASLVLAVFLAVGGASRRSWAAPTVLPAIVPAVVGQQEIPPEKVVGRETCAKCHTKEMAAWEESSHAKLAWQSITTNVKRTDFAKEMGIAESEITSSMCADCHGTKKSENGNLVVAHGNSCESCHGAAGGDDGWLATHYDFGLGDADAEMSKLLMDRGREAPAHRAQRLADCSQKGMIRSDDPLAIARNCLQCHIVPNEKLVAAKHAPSEDFEFVAWSQGEVRHNFLLDPSKNAEAPSLWLAGGEGRTAEGREKLMYVAGQLADLEVSLRARAAVSGTDRGSLGDLLNDRIQNAERNLQRLRLADLQPVLGVLEKNGIDRSRLRQADPGDETLFQQAADQVRAAAEAFVQAHKDGQGLEDARIRIRPAKGDVYTGR